MPSAASALVLGQRGSIKSAGQIPAGVYDTPQAILPAAANALTAYYSRAGMPASKVMVDHFVSFDGGATWDYAGGFETIGGPHQHRNGQITVENTLFVPGVPAERGRPRVFFSRITTADPHDITVDLKPDQVNAQVAISDIIAGMK